MLSEFKEINELSELKKIEIDILKAIHLFCQKNNITYYISYGTLLGAVRHKGFIPWDDDIDVMMPREDYEKFCRSFNDNINDHYELVNWHTKRYFGRLFSKVIDNRTVLIEPEYDGDSEIGVFVDVWPLDGLPKGKIKQGFHKQKTWLLSELFMAKIKKYKYLKKIRQRVLYYLCVPISKQWIMDVYQKEITRYPFSKYDSVTCYLDPYKRTFDKQWFAIKTNLPFEGAMFEAPSEYDKILKELYGDYLKLPPIDKQIPAHVVNTYWK